MLRSRFHHLILLLWFGFFAALPTRGADATAIYQCQPGPWGTIEYQTIWLEPPERVMNEFPLPLSTPRWYFPGGTIDTVRALLTEAHLDEAIITRLLKDPRARPDDARVLTLYPTPIEVEGLPPTVRDSIYHLLAQDPINEFYHDPITVLGNDVDGWLNTPSLPESVTALVRKLVYHDGNQLLFSDIATVISHAKNETEARNWIRALSRIRAVAADLRLDGTENLPELERYWSANFHRNDVLPILEGATHLPPGYRLDLIHLLPLIPRDLVDSYSTPNQERMGQLANCHWTSLNFFNYTPQNIVIDLKIATTTVLANYAQAQPPYELGDILFFFDEHGDAFHSCSYLADNLVLSKNGANELLPWIITPLDDVKALYFRKPGVKILVFRRKWNNETAP